MDQANIAEFRAALDTAEAGKIMAMFSGLEIIQLWRREIDRAEYLRKFGRPRGCEDYGLAGCGSLLSQLGDRYRLITAI